MTTTVSPPIESANIKFQDLSNLEEVQIVQDAFAKATGVASIITDTDGRPITKPSNFCRLCRVGSFFSLRQSPHGWLFLV